MSVSGKQRRDQLSLRVRIDQHEALTAIDGLVLDLQPQFCFDQLAELMVLGRVVRIDEEEELLIVSVEKGAIVNTCGSRSFKLLRERPVRLRPVMS